MTLELEKRVSSINGLGVFVRGMIARDETFYAVPVSQLYATPRARCARIGEKRYVDDNEVLNWVNHSCEPNSQLLLRGEKPFLFALRDIQDEEITVDYDETELHERTVACSCGTRSCRGYFFVSG
jgi:hypothetical protein